MEESLSSKFKSAYLKPRKMINLKTVLTAVLLFTLVLTASAQSSIFDNWETHQSLDEFDEPTGESYKSVMVQGTFSNSATVSSKCTYYLLAKDTSFTIGVFEYSSHAARFDAGFGEIKIKTPSKEVHTLKCYLSEGGAAIFFYDENEKHNDLGRLLEVLTESGEYMVVFSEGEHSKSNYKFKFTI